MRPSNRIRGEGRQSTNQGAWRIWVARNREADVLLRRPLPDRSRA